MLQDADLISIQEVRTKAERAWEAFSAYRALGQDQVDTIVERMAEAARAQSARLAELAVEETGYGNPADKLAKNLVAAELLPARLRGMATIGVLAEHPAERVTEIAEPLGVIAAVLPTTNPTSTAIYKTLIALKAGNAIVISPHPRAKAVTCATAEVLYRAATAAGAPEGLIQCLTRPTLEATEALMRHRRVAAILATGGSSMVKAAYSSGKPAFGVGPGNVPVLVDTSADVPTAIARILAGKTFDYGTLCSSEQTIVAETTLRPAILGALAAHGAHLCTPEQAAALEAVLFARGTAVNPALVGSPAPAIAAAAGFRVAAETRALVCEIPGIGPEHRLSAEKLSPVLAVHFVADFAAALAASEAILRFGGLGHTCGIYTTDEARARAYGLRMPAHRILVNSPTPQGSVGLTTHLFPALTLGCGAMAGNATGDNLTPLHLLHTKRIAWAVREPHEALPALAKPAKMASGGVPVPASRSAAAAAIVDRFLARRGQPAEAPSPLPAPPRPACALSAAPPAPAAPAPVPVDFVCEDDVRRALREGRKIHIQPKTIVTPSARDLVNQQREAVLILTEPPKTEN